MTNDEWTQLRHLLVEYAETELDQWVMWRLETPHGQIWIHIGSQPFWVDAYPDDRDPLLDYDDITIRDDP